MLKKAYIENLIYVYQREEEPMITYINYRIWFKMIFVEIWFFLQKLFYLFIYPYFDIIELYKAVSISTWNLISKKLMSYDIINVFVSYYNNIKEYFIYIYILFAILLYNIICWFLVALIRSTLPKKLMYGIKSYDSELKNSVTNVLGTIALDTNQNENKVWTYHSGSNKVKTIFDDYTYMDEKLNNLYLYYGWKYKLGFETFGKLTELLDMENGSLNYKDGLSNFKLKMKKKLDRELTEKGLLNKETLWYLSAQINKKIERHLQKHNYAGNMWTKYIDAQWNDHRSLEQELKILTKDDIEIKPSIFGEKEEQYTNNAINEFKPITKKIIKLDYKNNLSSLSPNIAKALSDWKILRLKTDDEIYAHWSKIFDDLEKEYLKTNEGIEYEKYWTSYWENKEKYWKDKYKMLDPVIAEDLIALDREKEKILEKNKRFEDYGIRKENFLYNLGVEFFERNIKADQYQTLKWLKEKHWSDYYTSTFPDFDGDRLITEIKRKWKIKSELKEDVILSWLNRPELILKKEEDWKMFDLKKKDNIFLHNKNFFDPEPKYIYYDVLQPHNFKEQKIIRKYGYFENEKKKIISKNYKIFYKKFLFETNLEKWENNTKIRTDKSPLSLLWSYKFKSETKGRYRWYYRILPIIFPFFKTLILEYRDRIFNHNRTIFWKDVTLDKESKITYYFAIPRIFFPFFFFIRFAVNSLKLWDWSFWLTRWRQYVLYGTHSRQKYQTLKNRLGKDWTLTWYRDNTDYGLAMYYKDLRDVVDKFNNIKNTIVDKKIAVEEFERSQLISKIIQSTVDSIKYDNILIFKRSMDKIDEKRKIHHNFDNRFEDIRTKLHLDFDRIRPKKLAEQKLMYKYRDKIVALKLNLEKQEDLDLKNKYTKQRWRDRDEEDKSLITLEWEYEKNIDSISGGKKNAVEYEKNLREHNFKYKIIDHALDAKDRPFFETLPEYKQDLEDAYKIIDENEKATYQRGSDYYKKSVDLYKILETHYLWYRWYTTMGARLNFILSQIAGIFFGWVSNMKKMRKNEFTVESLLKFMHVDAIEFIYRMYWEYLIVWKRYKTITKLGFSILDILRFSLILSPLIVYTSSLYLVFCIYFIYKLIINKFINKINTNFFQSKFINILNIKLRKINFIFNILFKDLETGTTIFDNIYSIFYKICGWIQRTYYFTKGAFILGYKEKGIFNGLNKVFYYFNLKYKAFIEFQIEKFKYWKNLNIIENLKKKYANRKESIAIKLQILNAMFEIRYFFFRMNIFFAKALNILCYLILKMDVNTFSLIYETNRLLIKIYYIRYFDYLIKLFQLFKKLSFSEFIKLFFRWIFIIITLPIIFVIDHQKWKYIRNYKEGIQGFRNNPMFKIIDNPKLKNDWRLKLHKLLMTHKLSNKLVDWKLSKNNVIDHFFMYKIDEVKWAHKNLFQETFWRLSNMRWLQIKETSFNFIIDLILGIEEGYQSFEVSIEFQNYSFWEKIKYTYFVDTLERDAKSYKDQRRVSRNLFFHNKIKEKRKIQRIYFIRGLLNWFSYLLFNKVIFTKVKDYSIKPKTLKNYGFKYRHIKYQKFRLKDSVHLSRYLNETPPQLWFLVILYDRYIEHVLRYRFQDYRYPLAWDPKMLNTRSYKWRITTPKYMPAVPFYHRRPIGIDHQTYHFNSFGRNLETKPYDPMIRWAIFMLEYGISRESLTNGDYNDVWIPEDDDNDDILPDAWGDISMSHLLHYDQKTDSYQYEIRDYNRVLKGLSWFQKMKNFAWSDFDASTLAKEKKEHYDSLYKLVSERIIDKNKDLLDTFVDKRKLVAAVSLHKALLRNKARTEEQKRADLENERVKDYFFHMAKSVFEDWNIEHYWEWKAEIDDKNLEDKYFNTRDIENITFSAQMSEKFDNFHGLDNPSVAYLKENIVLLSYDQTMNDILNFLKFKVWKVMDRNRSKKNINFKNLYLKPSYFKRINQLEHKKKKEHIVMMEERTEVVHPVTKAVMFEKTEKPKTILCNEYKYSALREDWEELKFDPLFNFIENNFFQIYFETGELFTYQDKIDQNQDASPFVKNDPLFHGNSQILKFWEFIRNRNYGLKCIRKNILKKRHKHNVYLNIGYINNIRWSWEQWLGYADATEETEILNKNIVILNERYRLWNLKRGPIRVKLPITLTIPKETKDFFQMSKNYATMEHRYYLLCRSVRPFIRDSLTWWICKEWLEKQVDKNITDLVMWLYSANALDFEARDMKKKYNFLLRNFLNKFKVFSKLYFVGMPYYSWDLLRYLDIWAGEDEPPLHKYFVLKQMEFLNHDPITRQIMKKVSNLGLTQYNPISFVFFFKYNYFNKILYHVYSFICLSSIIYLLKVIFYNPGEYLANYYMLATPITAFVISLYLRSFLKNAKDLSASPQLYLYKYQKSNYGITTQQWRQMQYDEEMADLKEKYSFYSEERRKILFGTPDPEPEVEIDPTWWRNYSHETEDNPHSTHRALFWFTYALVFYFAAEYWGSQKFKYRNHWLLWDYFYVYPEVYAYLKEQGFYIPENYFDKEWLMDSFLRLEAGGNSYSRWYENFYRVQLRGQEIMPLDYGYSYQTAQGQYFLEYDEETIISITAAYSDASWLELSTRLLIKIPDEIRHQRNWSYLEEVFKKKKVRFHDILSHAGFYDVSNVRFKSQRYVERFMLLDLNPWYKIVKEFKTYLRRWLIKKILGPRFSLDYNPVREWLNFIDLMKELYDFDMEGTIYTDFLIDNKAKTKDLIFADIKRYESKKDSMIFDYSKYIAHKKEIFFMKKKSFETGEPLDVKTLLSISENEKNLQILYHNFLKYKLHRMDLITNLLYETGSLTYDTTIDTVFVRSDVVGENSHKILEFLNDRKDINEFLIKKTEQYINNILKIVSYENKLEYKYNALLKLWNQEEISWWSWHVIKNILKESSFTEICDIVIKFINNIL